MVESVLLPKTSQRNLVTSPIGFVTECLVLGCAVVLWEHLSTKHATPTPGDVCRGNKAQHLKLSNGPDRVKQNEHIL